MIDTFCGSGTILFAPIPRLRGDLVVMDNMLLRKAVVFIPRLIAVTAPMALKDELGTGAIHIRSLHRSARFPWRLEVSNRRTIARFSVR
jgi:hypothetical protein